MGVVLRTGPSPFLFSHSTCSDLLRRSQRSALLFADAITVYHLNKNLACSAVLYDCVSACERLRLTLYGRERSVKHGRVLRSALFTVCA